MNTAQPLYLVGDVHGAYRKLIGLLQTAGLLDQDRHWQGGNATLCFVGDYVDRGPHGIAVIDLIMRLQTEAPAQGGQVIALLGNHDPLIIAARLFGGRFFVNWRRNGGLLADLEALQAHHLAWLLALPAMCLLHDKLIVHADSLLYQACGSSINAVNLAFATMLQSPDPDIWDALLSAFSDRKAFYDPDPVIARQQVAPFLATFGGSQLIHGHTPIWYLTQQTPAAITSPLIYADGLCIAIDGGMCTDSPGFVYRAV